MWIGGHRFVTNADIIRNIGCKLIINCTPDDNPLAIAGLHDDEQPVIVSWSILPNTHLDDEMDVVMENARRCWQVGGSILFHDNMG